MQSPAGGEAAALGDLQDLTDDDRLAAAQPVYAYQIGRVYVKPPGEAVRELVFLNRVR